MHKLKRLLVLAVLMLLITGSAGVYFTVQYMQAPLTIESEGIDISLARGDSLGTLTYQLAQQGVLQYPQWLKIYSRLTGRGSSVKAGDYFLVQGTTPQSLLDKLETGDVKYYQLTLVEGWNLQQVLATLASQTHLIDGLEGVELDQLSTALNIPSDYPLLLQRAVGEDSMEGLFFPDTYRFHAAANNIELLEQAFYRMDEVLQEEWENRQADLPYDNAYQALVMASVVEKETGAASERPEIAGVFVRRLNKGMRLQTDPSVIYGLGSTFDGNLRSRHLRDATNLFNSYRHHGLPPTPIALAGREAIHAALHPAKGDTLYFVAKGDGSHYFSRTLKEHEEAVRKYQIEQRRKDYSSAPPTNENG